MLQIISFPLFLLGIAFVRINSLKVPVYLLLFVLIFGSSFIYFARSGEIFKKEILIARIKGDSYESFTHLFKNGLESGIQKYLDASVGALSKEYSNHDEFSSIFENNNRLYSVIWGSDRWINYSNRESQLKSVRSGNLLSDFSKNLLLVSTIPVFGMSYSPANHTVEFLSRFFVASHEKDKAELFYKNAGSYAPLWTQSTHLSYSLFLLGNIYLERVLGGVDYQEAEMKCALNAYAKSASLILGKHNPELTAALDNNIGIAYYVKSLFSGKKKDIIKAKKRFKSAIKLKSFKNPFNLTYLSSFVAKINSKMIKDKGVNKKRRQKKNGKRRNNKKTTWSCAYRN